LKEVIVGDEAFSDVMVFGDDGKIFSNCSGIKLEVSSSSPKVLAAE